MKRMTQEEIVKSLGELLALFWNEKTPLEEDLDKYIEALTGAISIITYEPKNRGDLDD